MGARLLREVERSRPQRHAQDGYVARPEGGVVSPASNAGAAGHMLHVLHADQRLLATLRALTGRMLFPSGAAYLYYRPGDHTGLHTDPQECDVIVLARVAGSLGPLVMHPELKQLGSDELVDVARASGGQPDGGAPIHYPDTGGVVMLGRNVPHRRPVCGPDEWGVVATLCYRVLL